MKHVILGLGRDVESEGVLLGSFCAKANSTCQAPKINQDCFMKTRTNKKYYKTKYNENDKLRSLSKTKTKPKMKTHQKQD